MLLEIAGCIECSSQGDVQSAGPRGCYVSPAQHLQSPSDEALSVGTAEDRAKDGLNHFNKQLFVSRSGFWFVVPVCRDVPRSLVLRDCQKSRTYLRFSSPWVTATVSVPGLCATSPFEANIGSEGSPRPVLLVAAARNKREKEDKEASSTKNVRFNMSVEDFCFENKYDSGWVG